MVRGAAAGHQATTALAQLQLQGCCVIYVSAVLANGYCLTGGTAFQLLGCNAALAL
jgi:hypothetical protein